MDVSLAIKQRLDELGLDQRELARAAQVTESYISQLLTRRRLPPAPNRTDIYEKMDKLLKLPRGELAKLAAHQRAQQLKRDLGDEPLPLFGEVRALIIRKCHPARAGAVRAIFEKEPFGELERLVTKTILDLVKRVAKRQLENEHWLRTVANSPDESFKTFEWSPSSSWTLIFCISRRRTASLSWNRRSSHGISICLPSSSRFSCIPR